MKKLNFLRQYFAETNKENFTRKEVLSVIEVFCEPFKDLQKEIKVDGEEIFPPLTAKEIMEQCGNKVDGEKLLWNTNWYKNEDFFTKEKCRPISMEFTELDHLGKNWNKCNELGKMFNFAEVVYLASRFEKFREMLKQNCTWTSSRDSDGELVYVGNGDSGGAGVSRYAPGGSNGFLGVVFNN